MKLIGIDLGGSTIGAGLISNGSLEERFIEDLKHGSKEDITNQIINAIEKLWTSEVQGIGLGIPGPIDQEKGLVLKCPNIKNFENVPLNQILSEKFNVPVRMSNDANCFALGEKHFGKGKPYQSLVALIIGTGCGGGVIANGKLFEGANCSAGEFGQVPLGDGIWEHKTSNHFFVREHGLTAKEAFDRAEKGDQEAVKMFEQYGKNLGQLLILIRHAVDPEIIILGGSVSKALKYFEPSMRKAMEEDVYAECYKPLKVEFTELKNVYILGAAALFLE